MSLKHLSPLARHLAQSMLARGPLPLAQFVKESLVHPALGYYAAADATHAPIFGRRGDFVTSPDISPMFGELVAVHLVARWRALGSPPHVHLVELGPGRGALLGDVLARARAHFPPFFAALRRVSLVERSPALRTQQQAAFDSACGAAPAGARPALTHVAALDELDGGAGGDTARNGLLLLSHEFYDCLPARAFEFRERQWQEKYVAFDEARGVFQFVLRPLDAHVRRYFLDKRLLVPANADASSLSPELLLAADALRARTERRGVARAARSGSRRPDRAPRRRPPRANRAASDSDESTEYEAVGEEGDYLEISFDAMATFEHSVKLLRKHGGAQLLIDYGNFTVDYPSLRFIKDHKLVRADEVDGQFLVDNVGKIDMSIDVHFAPLMAIAHKHGVKSYLSTQGAFLERNGGQVLALTRLANCTDSAKAARLVADYERLTEPAEMGRIYKVLENEFDKRKES